MDKIKIALEALQQGRMVILVDDEDRENKSRGQSLKFPKGNSGSVPRK